MALTSVMDLIGSLRSLHLLEEAQLDKLKQLQARFPDRQALAKKLIEHRWLTPFQVNALLAGKGEHLLLGSYVLVERVGEGGMGEVYKARNWKMGRTVALKVIRKDKLLNPNAIKRFYREVQTSSQLAHPNIVLAFDAGEVNGRHYMAMEFVDGIDLNQLVGQKGPLPVEQACDYIRQAALGLQHAHDRGMVHRDIKPSNLFLSKDGVVKVLDMGLARMTEIEDTSMLTQEGSVLGTVDYLSPEQALDARKADIRSDLYSLGCAFYFLLAGKVPFAGGTATEKLLKHRLEEAPALEKVRPEVPPAIAAVVRKLMAKKPEDRYQTPADLVAALDAGGVAPRPSLAASAARGVGSLIGRIPLKWKLGLGAGVAGLVCLVLLVNAVRNLASGGGANGGGKPISTQPVAPKPSYVKMATRDETILATLKASGYPTLNGKWHYIGYFDNFFGKGVDLRYPPENEVDLSRSYMGRGKNVVSWKELPGFELYRDVNLAVVPRESHWGTCVYLYHEIDAAEALELPVNIGGDDSLTVWLNGERLLHERFGPVQPQQHYLTLSLKPGKNQLLVKVCNGLGDFWFHIAPRWPAKLDNLFGATLRRDFPGD